MQFKKCKAYLLLFGLMATGLGLYAQPANSGSEVLVNTTTAKHQTRPVVAMDTAGNYVVVWQSEDEDGDDYGIYFQRFNAAGTAQGSPTRVDNETVNGQAYPDVAMRPDGYFSIVYSREDEYVVDDLDCYHRLYDESGSTVTSPSRVNSSDNGSQTHPRIAYDYAGNSISVYMDAYYEGDEQGVYARPRNSVGSLLSGDVLVNTTTTGYQGMPDVARDSSGNYVIVWQSADQDGDGMGIYAQMYNSSLSTVGSEFQINTTTAGNQVEPQVGMDKDGNFVVIWSSLDQDGDHYGIYGQRFDNSATMVGSEFLVNTTTSGTQSHPRVNMTFEGMFTVTWESYGQDGNRTGVYLQAFKADGSTYGAETLVNTRTTDYQQAGCPAQFSDSTDLVVVWQDGLRNSTSTHDGDGFGIYSKIMATKDTTPPTPVCQNITRYLDGSGSVTITASDVDGGSSDECGIATYAINTSTFVCADSGSNTIILTVTDEAGNSAACGASVTVTDSTAPTATCQNLTVYLDGSGSATITSTDVDNGSSDNCGVNTRTASQTTFDCADVGTTSHTLTVTDVSSNSGTCSYSITVQDTSGPTATCQDLTVYLGSGGTATVSGSDPDNGSTDNCSLGSFSLTQTTFTCTDLGTNSETMTVTDAGGNTSTCATTITVLDTIAPTTTCQNITVYLDASGNASITTGDVDNGTADNCAVNSLGIDISSFTCSDIGANTVVLTADDASANSQTCTSTVTVSDSTSPTAACNSLTVYLDGTGSASITTGDVDSGSSDNCSVSSLSLDVNGFTCSDIGPNTVNLTATDPSANTGICSAIITVQDTTSPTATCQSITVYLDGSGSASITGSDIDNGSSDNCSISTYSAGTTSFSCSDVGANTVNLTVTDVSSNSSLCTSTVTVVDSTSPTAVCQAITLYLDGSGNATLTTGDVDAGSADNCSVSSLSLTTTAYTCSDIGSNSVTMTVTDANTNTSSCTAAITVSDSTSPTAACNSLTVYLDGSGTASITTGDVDSGSSDNCAVSSLSLDVSSFACTDVGTNTVNLTATDASANSGSCASTVTVVDSTSPSATCQSITVYLDGSGSASITGSDIDNGSSDNCSISTYSAGTTSFICSDVGANTVNLTVTDGSSNSSQCTSTVTVVDSTSPTATCQAVTLYLDGSGNATLTTGDVDAGSADNCSVSSLSLSTTAYTCADIGSNTVTMTVTDANTNTSSCTASITVSDTTSPTANCNSLTVYLDGTGSASITTGDVDNSSSDNCSVSSLSLSASSFTCADVGANTINLTVADASANSGSCSSTVTVVDSTSPTATCQSITVYLDGSGSASITGSDIDNGSSDNCSVSSLTAGTTSFSCSDVGANTVNLTVTDGSSNSSQCTSTVTVVDSTSPTATCQAVTLYLDGSGNATLTTGDVDAGSADNCSVSSLSLATTAYTCADIGSNSVTMTVTDANTNTSSCTASITVSDTTSPTANCNSLTVYLDGSGNASITTGDVDNLSSDNCSVSSLSLDVNGFTCSDVGSNTVNLTATDASANSGSCASTVTVVDSTSPTAACQAITVYLDGSGSASITGSDIDNGSSDNCSVSSLTAGTTSFACADVGANTVNLTVTDGSSNSSQCTSTVTVVDSTSPTATCQAVTLFLNASGNATLTTGDVDAGSADNCSVSSLSLSTTAYTCADIGSNSVTMTVTDANTNTSSCTAAITVSDTTSPTAACNNVTVILDGSGNASITTGDVDNSSSDNCTVSALSLDVSSFTCSDVGTNTVNLTVTDGSSNTSMCSATITVQDTVSPTATCQSITIYLDGSGSASITGSDIDNGSSDNCSVSSLTAGTTSFSCTDLGANTVNLTVTDAGSNSSICQSTVTVVDSTSPTAACQTVTLYVDGSGSATLAVSDIDGGSTDNCSISSSTLSATSFTCSDVGSNPLITLTLTDASSNQSTCQTNITVSDTISPTTLCTSPTIYLDGAGSASLTVSDVDGGSTDNCGIDSSWVSATSLTCSDLGNTAVILTVLDVNGNQGTASCTVSVLDTLDPTVSCMNATVYLDGSGSASITTTDVNAGDSDNCAVDTLTLDLSSFTCSDRGLNLVTITATDASGNFATCISTVDVLDTLQPTATCASPNIYLGPAGMAPVTISDLDAGSTDNCAVDSLSMTGPLNVSCADVGTPVNYTLTVWDASGNTSTCQTTATVLDTIPPNAPCVNDTVYLDGNGIATITPQNVDGGSSDNCGIQSRTVNPSTFNGQNLGANSVTFTVTDVNGNVSTCISTVYVEDTLMSGIGDPGLMPELVFDVYPSPTFGIVNMNILCNGCYPDDYELKIVSMDGKIIHRESFIFSGGERKSVFDLGDYSAGTYVVALRRSDGTIVRRVMKY